MELTSMELTLVVNTEDCVGCYACEIACKQAHNLPVGPRLIRVNPDGPRQIAGKMQLRYTVVHCLHCTPPPCQDTCPVGAISVRGDGITVINEELCNGCEKCIEACPYGVMQFNEVKKVAQKCDLCVERLDRGLKPACVAACPSHCIYFGDRKGVMQRLGKEDH
jgi:Fe-S-cluster-containing dehydrogenase component